MPDKPAKTDKPDKTETVPVVLSAPAPAPTQAAAAATALPAPDEFHGRGGRYTVINGVRQRLQCTEATHTQPAADKAKE